MTNKTWTIFGAGDLINDFIDAVESRGEKVKAIVQNIDLPEKILNKIPSSIRLIQLSEFKPSTDFYFFGFIDPNKQPFLESLKIFDLHYSNLVHQFSYVPSNVKMGEGNFIGAGVVIATNVVFGNFNYVNRSASIGHDTRVLNFNEFSPGCTVAGNCVIGNRNHFYSRSVLINNMQVGDDVIVGAGGVVIKNIVEPGTYVGVPVRKAK